MNKEKGRVPKLRFPGFTEDWEQRKLGDFTNQINTFVNPEDAKLPLWSLTAEAGLIEKSDRYERDFLVKKKDQFKRIETNTLVYNPMNITIGSIDIYTGLYPIAVSGYYVSIVYDKNIDTDFLKEVLLLPSSLKMYKNYATGSLIERQRVQYPTFSKLQLLLPNLDEQKAIGQLFKSLNLNITLHQRKLEHLNLKKKALLQKLFPKNGERYPELRFPGFTDAWEQRKVNEIFKVTRGQVLAASLTTPEKNRENIYPVYSSQTKDNGLLGYYSEYLFENAITWTTDGANAGTVNFRPGRFYSTNVNGVLINENGYACYAVSEIINKVAYKYVSKVGNPKLMNNVMAEINIMITPDIDELEQISKLIEAYNQYITLHQCKLEHLQLQKKALLQQMFV